MKKVLKIVALSALVVCKSQVANAQSNLLPDRMISSVCTQIDVISVPLARYVASKSFTSVTQVRVSDAFLDNVGQCWVRIKPDPYSFLEAALVTKVGRDYRGFYFVHGVAEMGFFGLYEGE